MIMDLYGSGEVADADLYEHQKVGLHQIWQMRLLTHADLEL